MIFREDEIKRELKKVAKSRLANSCPSQKNINDTQSIFLPQHIPYLNVVRLDDDTSLTDTIFLAVCKGRYFEIFQFLFNIFVYSANTERQKQTNTNDKHDQRSYSIKNMLDLTISWNYLNGINDILESEGVCTIDHMWQVELFEKSLINNRPAFVDYFLRRQHDVLETKKYLKAMKTSKNIEQTVRQDKGEPSNAAERAVFGREFIIQKLYRIGIDHLRVIQVLHFIYKASTLLCKIC